MRIRRKPWKEPPENPAPRTSRGRWRRREAAASAPTAGIDEGQGQIAHCPRPRRGAVFGRANILTEFDVVWEEGEGAQHLVVYEHHMEESAPSDDEASANADRIRGPRLKLIDSSEVPSIESVSLDGRLLTWSQGGCLVDAAKFELACMKWYSGPMGAGANAKAVALFRYLERARPELASDEAEICPLFGYPVAAFREAEDEEMAQAGGADCGEGGFDEVD